MSRQTHRQEAGFTLVEVLLVLGILSILSIIMVMTADGARKITTATQTLSAAQQSIRLVENIIERDVRTAGAGLYTNSYRVKNGGEAGEVVGNDSPDTFDYELGAEDLNGFMLPPIEVTNGTDGEINSYLNPIAQTFNLTSAYREPGTDVLTIYSAPDASFNGRIDDYTGQGQENFVIEDEIIGERVMQVFNAMGGKPMLVFVIDDEGTYATLRSVTDVKKNAGKYRVHLNPSNDVNQPTNFKGFLEDLGYKFNGPGGPQNLRNTVNNDSFGMVSAITYFIYTHPDPAMQAQGWLVRLDLATVVAGELNIDGSDPNTLRPFVVAEHVSDFQVALGIDSNDDGNLAGGEWHNGEDMETYIHSTAGEGTATPEFVDLINNLRAVRFSVVTYTDQTSEDDPFGFVDRNSDAFNSNFDTVNKVADFIGLSATLEDRSWTRDALADRLWMHRAVQQTRVAKVRNLDLENTFAREQ